jgi:Pectate lyase superfamily protein
VSKKRIPNPNSDADNWGTILNEHLAQTKNPVNGAFNFWTSSTRPAGLSADDEGRSGINTDTGLVEEWDGSKWITITLESGTNVWTTATRPFNLGLDDIGRKGINTDTGLIEQWNGTAWVDLTHNTTVASGNFIIFNQFGQRPSNLTPADAGKLYFYSQTGNFHQWSGTVWNILINTSINVKDYGAVGNGVSDDTIAIQAAINANSGANTKAINFPVGIYLVSNTILVYSSTRLLGEGRLTVLKTLQISGIMIEMKMLNNACNGVSIQNFIFLASISGNLVTAIKSSISGGLLLGAYFYNINFQTHKGFDFDKAYCQANWFEQITANGALEQFIYFNGNWNFFKDFDRESGTTANVNTTIPFIHLYKRPLTPQGNQEFNYQNVFENILLEGNASPGSVGKPLLSFDYCEDIEINTVHDELYTPGNFSHVFLALIDCKRIKVKGSYRAAKHTLVRSHIEIDEILLQTYVPSSGGTAYTALSDLFIKDTSSTVQINNLGYRSKNGNLHSMRNVREGFIIKQSQNDSQRLLNSTGDLIHTSNTNFSDATNLLLNPSFEIGKYGWGTSNNGFIATYIPSTLANGLMANFITAAATNSCWLGQDVYISNDMIGNVLTLSAWVKPNPGNVASVGYVTLMVYGCGVTFEYPSSVDGGENAEWTLLTQTFKILNTNPYTGTAGFPVAANYVRVGLRAVGIKEFQVDHVSLNMGNDAVSSSNNFRSINVSGTNISSGIAAPTLGTWKQGDIVSNSAATSGGYAGWICVAAGTPGTWKTFGLIS